MGKIVSRKLATKDSWIFSKSFHVFTVRKNNELKKKKSKSKGEEMTSFKCPECGATEVASNLCVSTDWSTGGEATSPWSYVLQQLLCKQCDSYIPSHLGERWNDITYEKAKKEWLLKYKKTPLTCN